MTTDILSGKPPKVSWVKNARYKYDTYYNMKVINVNQVTKVLDLFKEDYLLSLKAKYPGRFDYFCLYQPTDTFDPNDSTSFISWELLDLWPTATKSSLISETTSL